MNLEHSQGKKGNASVPHTRGDEPQAGKPQWKMLLRSPHEQIETILQAPGLRIERIVSRAQSSPDGFWYDQEDNEWVILLRGNAFLGFEGREDILALIPGDYIRIDRHQKHRVEWTHPDQETVGLAVHYK